MSRIPAVITAILATCLAAALCVLVACSPQEDKKETPKPEQVMVPNVLSLTQSDADKVLQASGLVLGSIAHENSDTVPFGSVITQTPASMTQVDKGSAVMIVVSAGKAAPKETKVPMIVGLTQADAEQALMDAGLVGVASNPEQTDAVAPGCVFKQSIDADTILHEGDKVAFTIAYAIDNTTVPDLYNKTRDEAKDVLAQAGLGFDYTVAYNDGIEADHVFAQSIPANTSVKKGTTVSIGISLGAKPASDVKVPNLMTFSWADAEATLKSAGLEARYTGDPAGIVVAQDVVANTSVAPDTLVTVTLSNPTPFVEVPNLQGMTITQANQAASQAGVVLDSASADGVVIDQWPAAGTKVEQRTVVHVTMEKK